VTGSRTGTLSALGIALVLASILRLWGLDYGIPHPTIRPDEERLVGRAQTIFATGNWHPGSFFYPSLPFYLDTAALHAYYGAQKLLGRYQKPGDFLLDIAVSRPGLHYRIARAASAASGVATVLAAYALSLAAQRRPWAAILATFSLAVCHVHVRDSHFATVDVLATFFLTLSLAYACRAAFHPRSSNFALAGLFAGLAASSKYNVGLAALPIGVAALYRGREAFLRLPLAAFAAFAAFAITSPYVLLRFGGFRSDMRFLENYLYRSGDLALWDHLRLTLPHGLGWPLYLAAILGLTRALVRRSPSDSVLLSFAIPYLALVSSVRITFPRYVLPLVPVLVVFAADLVADLLERASSPMRAFARALSPSAARAKRVAEREPWGWGPTALIRVLAAVVLLAPPLFDSIAFDRIAARDDTRIQAASFVSEGFSPQTHLFVCQGYGAPAIATDRRRPPAFVVEEVDCSRGNPLPPEVEILITHEHRELPFSRIHPSLSGFLEQRGVAIATFDPYRRGTGVEPVFHRADAFYIPFAGLEAVERGGPIVRIWKIQPR
jgi:hypothetical protein